MRGRKDSPHFTHILLYPLFFSSLYHHSSAAGFGRGFMWRDLGRRGSRFGRNFFVHMIPFSTSVLDLYLSEPFFFFVLPATLPTARLDSLGLGVMRSH